VLLPAHLEVINLNFILVLKALKKYICIGGWDTNAAFIWLLAGRLVFSITSGNSFVA
jgi:hypothetical protein